MVARGGTVSMKDVALLAGVSLGTVSNTFNNPELVSPATRARVQLAIDKLGWVPNESARSLRAGRSSSIGMVVMDISNPYFTDIVAGVEDAAQLAGYSVQVGNSAQDLRRERRHLDLLERQRVGGVLSVPINGSTEQFLQLRGRGIPVVVVDALTGTDFCSVSVDDVEGGRLAVDHLLRQGHRRIGFVGGPSDLAQVRNRRLGAQLATAGLVDVVSMLTISTPRLDLASGVAAAEEIAALPDSERPTAVFGANDLIAIGLLQGFVSSGMRIPNDISIMGYDDIAFAAAAAVPLSSVRQPRQLLGERAMELLLREIASERRGGEHVHEQLIFTPELALRRSTLMPQNR